MFIFSPFKETLDKEPEKKNRYFVNFNKFTMGGDLQISILFRDVFQREEEGEEQIVNMEKHAIIE